MGPALALAGQLPGQQAEELLPSADVVLGDVAYGTALPGDPDYVETVMDLIYPPGVGPLSLGYSVDPRPVLVVLRGGNEVKPLGTPAITSGPLAQQFLPLGYLIVEPNHHVVDLTNEPFESATVDVARVMQYLRANAVDLNIRPDRIVLLGRSSGGLYAFDVALRGDYQDLASADPVLQFSSRPDAMVSWAGPTDLTCLHPMYVLLLYILGVQTFGEITLQDKIDSSPTFWIANPALYARERTPYMAQLDDLSQVASCGWIITQHDGLHALMMLNAITAFDASQGAGSDLLEESTLIDTPIEITTPDAAMIAAWAEALPIMEGAGQWSTAGNGLAGAGAIPNLAGSGPLQPGSLFSLNLSGGPASVPAFLVIGFSQLNVPFKGGVLVPDPTPPGFIFPLLTDSMGALQFTGTWPATLPGGGATAFFQTWLLDPQGVSGFSASNGLLAQGSG